MLSPRTSLAITAFMAARPETKLMVPSSSRPRFDAYVATPHAARQIKFVELDPHTWTAPAVKRSCIDADVIMLWLVARSRNDQYYFVHTTISDVADECVIEDDVVGTRYVNLHPPYDRHISEWLCGSHESCALPPLATHASWRIDPIPRRIFSRDVWESLAHDATGELPFNFGR